METLRADRKLLSWDWKMTQITASPASTAKGPVSMLPSRRRSPPELDRSSGPGTAAPVCGGVVVVVTAHRPGWRRR